MCTYNVHYGEQREEGLRLLQSGTLVDIAVIDRNLLIEPTNSVRDASKL